MQVRKIGGGIIEALGSLATTLSIIFFTIIAVIAGKLSDQPKLSPRVPAIKQSNNSPNSAAMPHEPKASPIPEFISKPAEFKGSWEDSQHLAQANNDWQKRIGNLASSKART